MPQAKVAVIGGTGLYDIEGLKDIQQVDIETPFGKPSDTITLGKLERVGIAFPVCPELWCRWANWRGWG